MMPSAEPGGFVETSDSALGATHRHGLACRTERGQVNDPVDVRGVTFLKPLASKAITTVRETRWR